MGLQLTINQTGAEGASAVRERELEAGRLVQRAVLSAASAFVVRRAAAAVGAMERSPARAALTRAVGALGAEAGTIAADTGDVVEAADATAADTAEARSSELRQSMVCYGGVLERHCLWSAAAEAYAAAAAVAPWDPEPMMHLARSYRMSGNRVEALALYRSVRELSSDMRLTRFAELGEALLSAEPIAALTAMLAAAQTAPREVGEAEVCAVALEERARLHRNSGLIDEAVADYLAAALHYDGAQDRVRVMHAVADLMLARGDMEAAREAMYVALDSALPAQRSHIVHRLRVVARAQGDEVGQRRWPPASKPSALISLIGPKRGTPAHASHAALLRRWRDTCATAPVVSSPA